MLNFIASDYGALAPFQPVSAAIITLQALYIIVITILLLNALIAILNLKMRTADKNAANLYHLQMASLQVEIELGLLSSSERARRDWFPEWFSYSMTETEKRDWEDYVAKNPLRWTDENDFSEDKDHAPLSPVKDEAEESEQAQPSAPNASTVTESSLTEKQATRNSKASLQSSTPLAMSQQQRTEHVPHHGPEQLHGHESVPVASGDGWESYSDVAIAEESQEHGVAAAAVQASPGTKACCELCEKPGYLCTGCRVVAYCSKEHQAQHWRTHKSACKGKQKA